MGGKGSGRHRSMTDEQKKDKGTFRADQSEDALNAKLAEKIVIGPWLSKIPEPTIPLTAVGRSYFDQYTKLLFEQQKLTVVTFGDCEMLAVMRQQMHERLKQGKSVSMDLIKRIDSISARLRIADEAPSIADPGKKNRFEGSGFSNSRNPTFGLRPYTTPDSGEL